MDGDEQNQRHQQANRLRQQRNKHINSKKYLNGWIDEDGNIIQPLTPSIYKARTSQDELITQAIKNNVNSRYYELITLNNGRDYENELKVYLNEMLEDEIEMDSVMDIQQSDVRDEEDEEVDHYDDDHTEDDVVKDDVEGEEEKTENRRLQQLQQEKKEGVISARRLDSRLPMNTILEEKSMSSTKLKQKIQVASQVGGVSGYVSRPAVQVQPQQFTQEEDEDEVRLDITAEGDAAEKFVDSLQAGEFDKSPSAESKVQTSATKTTKMKKTNRSSTPDKFKEIEDVSVFHYPRNATGYYRGLWIRSQRNKTLPLANDDERSSASVRLDTSNLKAVDIKTPGADSSASTTTTTRKQFVPMTQLLQHMDDQGYLVQQNITSNEPGVQSWSQNELVSRKNADVCIMFLPPSIYMEPDVTSKNITKEEEEGNDKVEKKKELRKSSATTKSSTSPSKPSSLSLTNDAGRAAFQLYSKPIPAMNEISIVDGLIKLYDGMTTSFSRRTDVLLRVKGVMIHGVGKLSLVTTGGGGSSSLDGSGGIMKKRRSFLAVRQVDSVKDDEDVDIDEEKSFSEDNPFLGGDDDDSAEDVQYSSERRRRLQLAVEDLLLRPEHHDGADTSTPQQHEEQIESIRNEALDLYSSLYINESTQYLDKHDDVIGISLKKDGWTRLQSVDDDIVPLNEEDEEIVEEDVDSDSSHQLIHETPEDSERIDKKNASTVDLHLDSEHITQSHRSTLTLTDTEPHPTRYVYPYPYVIDDSEDSIQKASSPASRKLPGREQALEANAANCEFEINIDIQSTKWTFGEWRSSMEHRLRMGGVFNPNWNVANSESDVVKMKRSQYLSAMKSQLDFLEEEKTSNEALVMTMMGDIESKNCDFHSFVNVTAMRTDWDHTTAKAINYSFYMMLTCLTQIVILLRQLLHTQSQSVASNVSLMCIGWQTVLDAILCISHIFLCLVMQPLFTAFASVAFFKLLIFCVIEMKYMAIIIQARNNANNTGISQEEMRRQITLLHMKFYGALMSAILAFWYFGQTHRKLYVLVLYSFWVPQIILNIITESRKPMHPYYMYGMSLTRTVAPVYVFAVRNNFLKEVNPDFPTEPQMCQLLVLWVAIQTAILYAQSKYGTRFMIPQR